MGSFSVRRAVITAAGRGVRLAPAADTVQKGMLPIMDSDGLSKPVLQIIAEEALDAGIEELCVVCAPGDEERYRQHFAQLRDNLCTDYEGVEWAARQVDRLDNLIRRLSFAVQQEPLGYGHAVWCARDFAGGNPFLLLLGDHVYISGMAGKNCASQLIELACREEAAVSAVHATREHLVQRYGTVSGRRMADQPGVYQIERIIEKPSISRAELELQVPGLRSGHYLCFFGMHVLTPGVFDLLDEKMSPGSTEDGGGVMLTPALEELARRECYLALEVRGTRYDIGARFGLLRTQLALALAGSMRDEVLAVALETLAESARGPHTEQS